MNAQERLRQAIDHRQEVLCAAVPRDRAAAILALVRLLERLPLRPDVDQPPDLVTGRRLVDPGGAKALQRCLEAEGAAATEVSEPALEEWAERFLAECGRLAEAELVLADCETGFMRLVEDGAGTFDAWIATKRPPASWRERADIDWWAARLAVRNAGELSALRSERPDSERNAPASTLHHRQLADVHLRMIAYQFPYPLDATIGGRIVTTYLDVLRWLIASALQARDAGEPAAPRSERALIAAIAAALDLEPEITGDAVAAFTLDRTNAAYHAAVPDVAPAPLIRVGPDRLLWSVRGLTSEPLFFLARELRRRDAPAYHNAAFRREEVFRHDLYALFDDKRFVTSAGRIALRREGGDVRTDIDAVVFDRKSGAIGIFELKSHDPFARSTAELARQRDNVLYANRQLSGALAWLQRHGADALLSRVDARTARTFRAQKVVPFVLGRSLVQFDDGPPPDRRAAWGTWPQVLRLRDGQPFGAADANPLAWLFSRLQNDVPIIGVPVDLPSREIAIGDARLTVHPSYAAFQAATGDSDRTGSRA